MAERAYVTIGGVDSARSGGGSPQRAATIVLIRPAAAGFEVLLLRRSAASRFAPAFVVFPGGSVESEDSQLAKRWFGSDFEADRACAVRELYEEAGLALTAGGIRSVDPGRGLEMVSAAPPGVDSLPEMARWIAPEFLARRFDARFFAAVVLPGIEPRPDGVEADRAWWSSPLEVLHTHKLGETLMWPTFRTLEQLSGCASVEDALSLRVDQGPPPLGKTDGPRPMGGVAAPDQVEGA